MAEKRTIDINIKNNADKATKDFKQFNKALDETAKSAKNVNSTFEEVYGDLQPLTTRLGEAEDRLYELALAGDTTSKEYQELLTKVGEYRKVQIQTDLAVDGAATTLTQKLGSALNGVTSGFAATQGALALFGSENEALEKTLLKVQAALAIQQGVEGLTTAYRELAIGTKIATAAKTAYATVTGTTTGLLKAFRIALASTGIGLLVVAVATLIANFDKLTSVFKPVINGFKAITDAIGLTNFASDERQEKLKKQRELEAEIAEEELKAHNARMDQMRAEQAEQDKLISKEIELAQARGEDITEMQEDQLKTRLKNLQDNFAKEEKAYRKAEGESVDFTKSQIKDAQKAIKFLQKEGVKSINQLNLEVKNDFRRQFGITLGDNIKELRQFVKSEKEYLEYQAETVRQRFGKTTKAQIEEAELNIQIFNARTTASEKAEQKRKLENYKRYLQDRLNARRRIEDLENSLLEDGIEKELLLNEVKFRRLREDTENNTKLTLDERKELNDIYSEQEKQSEAKIRDKFRKEALKEEIDFFNKNKLPILKAQADEEVSVEVTKWSLIGQAQAEAYKKEEALRKRNQDFAVQTTLDGLSLISDITELFGKKGEKQAKRAFQVQKAAQIAAATIETYRAAQSAYLSQFLPVPDPSSPVRGGIAAGVAVAAGIANIAKIASQKFEGGGATGGGADFSGGGVGGGEVVSPEFNVVGDAGINQLAQLQQQPTQAYVVSGDVTSAQALDRNRVQNATL